LLVEGADGDGELFVVSAQDVVDLALELLAGGFEDQVLVAAPSR
jgi:hypothetical protein